MNKISAEDFWKVLQDPLSPTPEIFYRLYYRDNGSPVTYTMEDLPGNYIEVDRDTYVIGSYRVRVIDQKLVHLPPQNLITKLRPNTVTGTACDPRDVCVVVSEDVPHTKWSF
jgi:hypothetical protein